MYMYMMYIYTYIYIGEKTIRSCTNDIKNKENKEAVVRRLLQNSCHLFFISYWLPEGKFCNYDEETESLIRS